jgi:hypothetical protein
VNVRGESRPHALTAGGLGVRLGDNRPDERSDHPGLLAGDVREDVGQQVDAAALPGRSLHRPANGRLQAPVRVGDHEIHTSKTAVLQAGEEAGPEQGVLGVPDVDAEDLTDPSAVTPVAMTTARETT